MLAERATSAVDPKGNKYEITQSIESFGQRIAIADFETQVEKGPLQRNGKSFGFFPPGDAGDSALLKTSPDFIAALDTNGSPTIIGFVAPGAIVGFNPQNVNASIPVLGSDGRTIVGQIVSKSQVTVVDGAENFIVDQDFVPETGGQK